VPFGPPGVENFAVAPNGAFIVYGSTQEQITSNPITYLFLLDEAGHALGEPLRSPIGAITRLEVSPKGDRIAASSDKGWMAVLAVQGTGPARRLAVRAEFGVKADRQFTFAFRPDGGLVTLVVDWVATWRSNDGVLQRILDLKTINRDLVQADQEIEGGLFQLNWSPRGDRFAVSWGGGPMFTTIFDSAGHRLGLTGAENGFDFGASKVEFVDGGDAMILYGMQAPVLVRMKSLAPTAFGDPSVPATSFTSLAGGREIALLAGDRIALWSLEGKPLAGPVGLENYSLGAAAGGVKDEAIVAAERSGWVDLYTKGGKFMRRVQSGSRERHGFVALSGDGATVAALGGDGLGLVTQPPGRAWGAALDNGPLVAMAPNGSRIVTEGLNNTLRSWSRDGVGADSISLKVGEQVPDRRLSGLAISTNGDAIAVAEDGSAVWLAYPADKSVVRVALAARSVAPLPDGTGFAIGLADGTAVRVSRDGTVPEPPFKAFERHAVGRIVVAPDGQSLIVVDGDEGNARHLTWDGKVLAEPYRASQFETISGAFFHGGSPKLILRKVGSTSDESFAIANLAPPGERQVISLEPPR
jgi:WD40 repeat protein